MKPKILTIDIENFRMFRRLRVEGLGRVNLITGRNNTGKSSVLEALRILMSEASSLVMSEILRDREEILGEAEEPIRLIDNGGVFQMSTLFHGFPRLSSKLIPISISTTGETGPLSLRLRVGLFSEERTSDGIRRFVAPEKDLFGMEEGVPMLVAEVDGSKRTIPLLDPLRELSDSDMEFFRNVVTRSEKGDETRMPCIFVSPHSGKKTSAFGALWDRIALSDREKDVVEVLRIIDPEISAISMVSGGKKGERRAIVRANNRPRPVPLRLFGDGLNRLFGIALSLVNVKDGVLLIDEFENGMHHTVQLDAWRAVFALSHRLNIQVFATSHSWDAIEAFQKAAAESPEEGALVRLTRRGEDIVPTVVRKDELAIATRDRIEVR